MTHPRVTRPRFPPGYLEQPKRWLDWSVVETWLSEAVHYWLCTVSPDLSPHAVPLWGVWVRGKVYFDGSPATRHARNLTHNPRVVVHLESGERAVILSGWARAIERPETDLAEDLACAYRAKYAALGYAPEPTQWEAGGLFEVRPQTVLAWSQFTEDPTRFVFEA